MAATVSSAWSKPGAWALDSEENEAELLQQHNDAAAAATKPLADFPSLAVAAATKPKKKKGQTLSLAEFTAKPDTAFADQDPVVLPTGPRQRTAEELDRTRLGGGFRSYGDRPNRNGDESSNSRWGSSRVSDEPRRNGGFSARDSNREMQPSRADETDNWAAAKKPSGGGGFERRERDRGGFFDSQSRADESDSWVTNKSFVPSEGRRFGSNGGGSGGFERERRVVGFGSSGGADSDNWNKKKGEKGESNGGSESGNGVGFGSSGGADSDNWNRKRGDKGENNNVGSESGGGVGVRPRLVLQPKSMSVSNEGGQDGNVAKPKGVNSFGEARPKEQVLAKKGQDWKKIDEQLESLKIKGTTVEGFGKRGFGSANGGSRPSVPESRAERRWKKPQFDDDHPQRYFGSSMKLREYELQYILQRMEICYQAHIDREIESLIERIHPPRVYIDNDSCQDCTVVKVDSANRKGTPPFQSW